LIEELAREAAELRFGVKIDYWPHKGTWMVIVWKKAKWAAVGTNWDLGLAFQEAMTSAKEHHATTSV
jgi:hypothetical protein